MKIEIWSDFTCPLCYIGKRKLELALQQFEKREYVKVEFKSYQFDRNENGKTMFDWTNEVFEQAESVGLSFELNNVFDTNTFNAHRLVKYAHKSGEEKELALIDLLFRKYFIQNENIGEKDVLKTVAKEVDLNENEVEELLALNKYANAVQTDEELAREIGIENVPFFIINEKYALDGAQPPEVFVSALEQVWAEEKETILRKKDTETSYCAGDDCE